MRDSMIYLIGFAMGMAIAHYQALQWDEKRSLLAAERTSRIISGIEKVQKDECRSMMIPEKKDRIIPVWDKEMK